MQTLAEALKINTTLIDLDLWENQLTDIGKKAEAEIERCLKRNQRLQATQKYAIPPLEIMRTISLLPPSLEKSATSSFSVATQCLNAIDNYFAGSSCSANHSEVILSGNAIRSSK